jgi:ABC-type bacteriocin/lantibiotic exporter with double-glycine peptidase domain
VLVYSKSKVRVVYADSRNGIKAMSLNNFLEKWRGVAILIELLDSIFEPDFRAKRSDELVREALGPLIVLILFLAGFSGINSLNLFKGDSQFHDIFLLVAMHFSSPLLNTST